MVSFLFQAYHQSIKKFNIFFALQDPYVLFKSQRVTVGHREDAKRKTDHPTYAGTG